MSQHDNENAYWALRQTEYNLQTMTRERDALRSQLEWLQVRLVDTQSKLDSAYSRYHDISIASIDLVERAFDELPSAKSDCYLDARNNMLVLINPINRPTRKSETTDTGDAVLLRRTGN